jgi:hypothetical protein
MHVDSDLECAPSNLIVLCRRDHFLFGHLGDWSSWNKNVRGDASMWRVKIATRPGYIDKYLE